MAEAIKMPGDGLILNWLKNAGDAVKEGEVIVEVEADKATVEVESPVTGVLLEIVAQSGDEVEEGRVIAHVGASGEKPEAAAEAAAAPVKAEAAASTTGQSKATSAPPAPVSAPTNGASRTPEGRVKASPIARRIADERGISLDQIKGSGPGGRIVKSDVETFTPSAAPAFAPAAASGASVTTYGKVPEGDGIELIDISRMRARIAENTLISKQGIPHFYVTSEMDVTDLLDLRKQLNASLESSGTKITVNDMIVKATALTLRDFPNLNSHFYGDKIVRYKHINIGIAVALPNNGLLNVVAKDADKVALGTLSETNKAMIARARESKVKPEDIKGSTFTTSNLGPFDVEHFLAIINPPESGIIAVGSARKIPVVLDDGTFGVGNRMKVTISVDHRVSDGAEGAQFMQRFKNLIEHPMQLVV